jgi:uncharacterized membrane protein
MLCMPVHGQQRGRPAPPELRNIRDILRLETEDLLDRSLFDRVADSVSRLAGGPLFFLVHMVWFGVWISANDAGIVSFDPPPFNLLMMVVSLEAIVLTGFVLRAQSRMAMIADRRAQLDLQINLLAEQELTTILRVLCSIGDKVGIDVAGADPRVEQFRSQTDVRAIAAELDREKAVVDAARPRKQAGRREG